MFSVYGAVLWQNRVTYCIIKNYPSYWHSNFYPIYFISQISKFISQSGFHYINMPPEGTYDDKKAIIVRIFNSVGGGAVSYGL
jgi:hypothetical protein